MKKSGGVKSSRKTNANSRLTQSLENISASSSGRKASTPIKDQSVATNSPDISHVFSVDSNTSVTSLRVKEPKKTNVFKKPEAIKIQDIERELDFEYTRYLQTAFKKKIMEKQSNEMDEKLDTLQKRIADNQRVLQLTTNRLKNIQFNKEIELLHSLHNPDYGRVLETHNSLNYDQQLSNLNEKLELSQNQLKVKDVEIPEGGAGQLLGVITDTLTAFENLKKGNNIETSKILTEANTLRKEVHNVVSRCVENLQMAEDTTLTSAVMKLSEKS